MVVFHHNDMDGYGSASLVLATHPNSNIDNYYEVNYEPDADAKFDQVSEGEEVWIVDYSFTEDTADTLRKLMDKKCKIVWIDHHESSINLELAHPEFKILRGIRNKAHSGIALVYMFIKNCTYEECPKYVRLISDYDTFQRNMLPESDYFKLGYDSCEDKWAALATLYNTKNMHPYDNVNQMINIGKTIKSYLDVEYKSYRNKYGFEATIDGVKTFVINRKCNSWLFGEKYDEYPMICSYCFNGEMYDYSLYSADPSVDCSKIAEKFGGGGHKGAAGFLSKEIVFEK